MNGYFKKTIISFLIFFCLFLNGCGEKVREKKLIIWVTHNPEELKLFREICKEWSEKTKFPIMVKRIPWGGHEAKIRSSLTIHANPDIARVDCSFVQELARFNGVEPLNDYGFEEMFSKLNKAALKSNLVNGKYYGIPDQATCLALFYNKKLLADKGVELPQKLDVNNFVEILKKVTDKEQGIYGIALEKSLWFHLPFFYCFGADLLDSTNRKFILSQKPGVEALQYLTDLYRVHKVEAGSWQAGSIGPEVGFLNQKYAFILSGPWNLARFNSKKNFDYGVTLLPEGPGGKATNIGGTNMVIFKKSPFKKEAAAFLKYFLSKEVQARWSSLLSQIPVNTEANALVNFSKLPQLKVFLEQIQFARARPQIMKNGKLFEAVEAELEAAFKGDKGSEEALKAARANAEKKVPALQ
ncbi:extracellular solute-binding protein [Candidatus Riflebacteria bacterium]